MTCLRRMGSRFSEVLQLRVDGSPVQKKDFQLSSTLIWVPLDFNKSMVPMDLDWYHLFPLTSSESPHSEPHSDSPVIPMDLRGWLESQVGFQLIFNWTSHFQSGPVDGFGTPIISVLNWF